MQHLGIQTTKELGALSAHISLRTGSGVALERWRAPYFRRLPCLWHFVARIDTNASTGWRRVSCIARRSEIHLARRLPLPRQFLNGVISTSCAAAIGL